MSLNDFFGPWTYELRPRAQLDHLKPSPPLSKSIVNLFRRYIDRPLKYLCGLPPPLVHSEACLDDLPVELLLEIAQHLPQESVMILSLASKKFHAIFPLPTGKLEIDTTVSFLDILGKDLSSPMLCLDCLKFYEWKECENGVRAECKHWRMEG